MYPTNRLYTLDLIIYKIRLSKSVQWAHQWRQQGFRSQSRGIKVYCIGVIFAVNWILNWGYINSFDWSCALFHKYFQTHKLSFIHGVWNPRVVAPICIDLTRPYGQACLIISHSKMPYFRRFFLYYFLKEKEGVLCVLY